ncbi:UNVERIFIED_CONTAM: hypothetical protein GTU68_057257 [Idotea baltica]|nr:hypothetical protein [Idotea baltica]
MYRIWILPFLAGLIVLSSCRPTPPSPSDEAPIPIVGQVEDSAMVACSHPLAAEVGRDILFKGGNAIDAAVGVHFALAVTFPYAGNLGGGGFMVYRAADGTATTLDFREKAPAKAHRDMYLDDMGEVVPELSSRGPLAVGVPGSVDGMFEAHRRYGKLTWPELIQPAIDLARNGYAATQNQAEWLNKLKEDFEKYNPEGAYLVKENPWQSGDLVVQSDLATSLERVRDGGRDGFYKGKTAQLFVEEMERSGGWITASDLESYSSTWREPIRGTYKDYGVLSMGPPSSGGILLVEMLNMVEESPLQELGFQSRETAHLMVEAERRAFADRAEFLGDPDYVTIPQAQLLSKAYAKARMADFNPKMAHSSDSIGPGPAREGSGETTHYSIVDYYGNAVSITTTLNSAYGSRVWVKGAGFLLNNEMDDFSAKPGVPNQYGLVGNEANAIAPGKRMLSSMTPTIFEKDNQLFMVVGTPGGSTIITSVFQAFLNVVEFDMTMQEAVDNKRFHHQWLPDVIRVEEGAFSPAVRTALQEMGHQLDEREPIGRVDAILIRADGMLEGAADHTRRDDTTAGF